MLILFEENPKAFIRDRVNLKVDFKLGNDFH